MKSLLALAILTLGVTFGVSAQSMDNLMVGGAAMYKTKNIVENAVNSKEHTTLVAAVMAAGLVDTLMSGPFTVFAPLNSAFDALPARTVEMLLKPENKATLAKILTSPRRSRQYGFQSHREGDKAWQRQSRIYNGCWRQINGDDGRQNSGAHRRERRKFARDDRRRSPIERRDPCGRYYFDAELVFYRFRW